jgi:hypothetical protein
VTDGLGSENTLCLHIDISVASLVMTTERESVIDFVSPYFDQAALGICQKYGFEIAFNNNEAHYRTVLVKMNDQCLFVFWLKQAFPNTN